VEETAKHTFPKISYIFALRRKHERGEPMKKMENLNPCWSWNCIMIRILVCDDDGQ
jgi:hypothetical protein